MCSVLRSAPVGATRPADSAAGISVLRSAPVGANVLVDSTTGVSCHNVDSRRVERTKSAPIRNVIGVSCNHYVIDVSHAAWWHQATHNTNIVMPNGMQPLLNKLLNTFLSMFPKFQKLPVSSL